MKWIPSPSSEPHTLRDPQQRCVSQAGESSARGQLQDPRHRPHHAGDSLSVSLSAGHVTLSLPGGGQEWRPAVCRQQRGQRGHGHGCGRQEDREASDTVHTKEYFAPDDREIEGKIVK